MFYSDSTYSKVPYSVDSLSLEYLCNCWSDSHGGFDIGFGMEKLTTLNVTILILRSMVKTPCNYDIQL